MTAIFIILSFVIMATYIIQDREAGNVIESFATLAEAEQALASYEEDDKKNDVYEENFYEIIEVE